MCVTVRLYTLYGKRNAARASLYVVLAYTVTGGSDGD